MSPEVSTIVHLDADTDIVWARNVDEADDELGRQQLESVGELVLDGVVSSGPWLPFRCQLAPRSVSGSDDVLVAHGGLNRSPSREYRVPGKGCTVARAGHPRPA